MKTPAGKIRIISGKFKGRVIRFPATKELRPSPDRVRETLFNWLMPQINCTHCLDLFAGSGALGFEAISRGAESVIFVEANNQVAKSLDKNIQMMNLSNTVVHKQNALSYLKHCTEKFDIVFLDPPFRSTLLNKSIQLIKQKELINEDGFIYVESSSHDLAIDHPADWQLFRTSTAGDVRACLFKAKKD